MTVMNVDKQGTKRVWDHFISRYKVNVINKKDSRLMKFVGWLFARLKIMSKATFLDKYHTSLLVRNKRYLYTARNFVMPAKRVDKRIRQLEVLSHELYHLVIQKLGLSYLRSKYRVVKAETEAYLCDMELHHYLTGNVYPPEYLAERLKGYNCGEKEVAYAKAKYKLAASMIDRGHYQQHTVLEIISYIEKNRLFV